MLSQRDYLSVSPLAAQHTKLAVLCCLFANPHNPHNITNYWKFAGAVRRVGLPLYTIECSAGDPFQIPQDGTVLRRQATTPGWHKERLLNILERYVPPRYTKLAWIDADILFQNSDWATLTESTLDQHEVLQLFSECFWLDRDSDPDGAKVRAMRKAYGKIYYVCQDGRVQHSDWPTQTGFAWAMRRDCWRAIGGLCDRVPGMSSDVVMAHAFVDAMISRNDPDWRPLVTCFIAENAAETIRAWQARAAKRVQRSVGFVHGLVHHLWHGSWESRQYRSLTEELARLMPDYDSAIVDDPARALDAPRITRSSAFCEAYQNYFAVRSAGS